MPALAPCREDPVDLAIEVIVAETAEGQDVLLEVHVRLEDDNETETITAVVHAQEAENAEGQKVEVMTHDIRVDEERSTRKRESQAAIAVDPEIELT